MDVRDGKASNGRCIVRIATAAENIQMRVVKLQLVMGEDDAFGTIAAKSCSRESGPFP